MDLFKFNTVSSPSVLEQGEAINGYTGVFWAERYRDPGEFEITSKLSAGLWPFLPLGTLIGHADSLEVMVVENHEIEEKESEDPTLKTTGRSLDSWLENRIVGVNHARSSSSIAEYSLAQDWSWTQAAKLINDHIGTPPANANDVLTNVVATAIAGTVGSMAARVIDKGPVHARLLEILQIDDLGIKTVRRNPFGEGSNTETRFVIHQGTNRSKQVIFSWKGGDLTGAAYLFSLKKRKTSALVMSRYLYTVVDQSGPVNYNRRIMIVDADDIDGHLTAPPAGAALTTALQQMQIRGNSALEAQKDVAISRADISPTTRFLYRLDYNIGDLVTLDGNFGAIQVMRVVEHVEIEDENGESSHPTLALPEV